LHIAGLRHEAFDHAVEGNAIIGAFIRKCGDLINVVRGHIGQHVNNDAAAGFTGDINH